MTTKGIYPLSHITPSLPAFPSFNALFFWISTPLSPFPPLGLSLPSPSALPPLPRSTTPPRHRNPFIIRPRDRSRLPPALLPLPCFASTTCKRSLPVVLRRRCWVGVFVLSLVLGWDWGWGWRARFGKERNRGKKRGNGEGQGDVADWRERGEGWGGWGDGGTCFGWVWGTVWWEGGGRGGMGMGGDCERWRWDAGGGGVGRTQFGQCDVAWALSWVSTGRDFLSRGRIVGLGEE